MRTEWSRKFCGECFAPFSVSALWSLSGCSLVACCLLYRSEVALMWLGGWGCHGRLLSGHSERTERLLSRCCRLLPGCFQVYFNLLTRCSQVHRKFLSGCSQDALKLLPGCLWLTLRLLPGCSQVAFRVLCALKQLRGRSDVAARLLEG